MMINFSTFNKIFRGRAGFSLLSGLLAIILVSVLAFLISNTFSNSKKTEVISRQKFVAQLFVIELLELLRGHDLKSTLFSYLQVNPSTLSTTQLYPLCAHINILDRNSGVIANPDPIANLPASILDRDTARLTANRFYQVTVLNTATQTLSNYCNYTTATAPALLPSEVVLVTVGVSWIPREKAVTDVERVVMTTLLPNNS